MSEISGMNLSRAWRFGTTANHGLHKSFIAPASMLLLALLLILLASFRLGPSTVPGNSVWGWLRNTGHFLAWLAISTATARVFSMSMSAQKKSVYLFVFFFVGMIVTILSIDQNWLARQIAAGPLHIMPVYRASIVSNLALLFVPAWLTSGRSSDANRWFRITTLQIGGFTVVCCLFLTVVRSHGTSGFAQISTFALLALLGGRLSVLATSDRVWRNILAVVAITSGVAALLLVNQLGIGRWNRTHVLAMYTMGGIGPLTAAVTLGLLASCAPRISRMRIPFTDANLATVNER